ncbi:hypothetical protein HPP92_023998 [Vanilla planifolia]|uniref:Uncharacterized protein n=1 Tax=Vanilla planifolia TaxID=51239 RepID=A0A835PPG8_VANPL|nr:hypothetical protein HPP92_023998 [Vanilla planifolia]
METSREPKSKPLAITQQSLQTHLSFKPLECLSVKRLPSSTPTRRTANYQPSLWDDFYIQSLSNDSLDEVQVDLWEKLREEMKQLIGKQEDMKGQLEFIDAMGQLGVLYHFQNEIKNVLGFMASSYSSSNDKLLNNLYVSILLFRLLREQGLKISHLRQSIQLMYSLGDLLQSLKSGYVSSKLNIEEDVKCILGLYEACFLAMEGEDEVDEAIENLTERLVKVREKQLSASLCEQIDHALELPIHWRMPRLHTRWFIDAYEKQDNMDPKLLQFAKLDFNLLQSIYMKELKELSRMNITKFGALLTTIDDVYDVYGSLDELQLFTTAIIEWNINAIHHLPNYMKIILRALFDTINDVANTVLTEKGLDILPHLKRGWGDQCKAYLVEAMWYHSKYTPKLNEYLDNAWITIGSLTIVTPTYLLSEDLTSTALEELELYLDVLRYSCTIARLMDDLGTSTDELQRGDVSKSIQCYMKEKCFRSNCKKSHKILNKRELERFEWQKDWEIKI